MNSFFGLSSRLSLSAPKTLKLKSDSPDFFLKFRGNGIDCTSRDPGGNIIKRSLFTKQALGYRQKSKFSASGGELTFEAFDPENQAKMFKNTFQSGFLSILYSIGSKPLQIWDKKVRNGHIKRITDNDIQSLVLEIVGTNVSTTFISCPADPKKTLGIKLPFLVMIIKNLKKYFTFEVQVIFPYFFFFPHILKRLICCSKIIANLFKLS